MGWGYWLLVVCGVSLMRDTTDPSRLSVAPALSGGRVLSFVQTFDNGSGDSAIRVQ